MPTSEKFWNKRAGGYDAKSPQKGPNYAARLERAAAVFGAQDRVLDVGCATGEITLDLAPHCGSILGLDHAERMVELANEKAKERGVGNAAFRALDPADASLEPGAFDAATVYSVFHLADDYPAMLKRLHELLKPGGRLITETPCLGDWAWYWRGLLRALVLLRVTPNISRIRLTELEANFRDAGFEVLDSRVYNPKSGMQCVLARKA